MMDTPVFLMVMMVACLSGWHTATYLSRLVRSLITSITPHTGYVSQQVETLAQSHQHSVCREEAEQEVSQNTCLLLRRNNMVTLR